MRNRNLVTAELLSASTGLRLLEGRVTAVSPELGLLVEDDSGQPTVICAFLRTGAERLPDVCAGDRVVFVRADDPARGYVLGIVEDCRHANRRTELDCAASRTAGQPGFGSLFAHPAGPLL